MNFVDVESRFRPGQLIRYAYSGLILLLLAVWLEPERIGPVLEDLGVFLTAMVVGVVGIAAYVLYKELLGEFLLYPARHMLHTAAAKAVHRARQGRAPEAGSVGSVPALLLGLEFQVVVSQDLAKVGLLFDRTKIHPVLFLLC